jgi:protein-S-isoprenylcysteine O-methyltransferase Ste14
MNKAQGLVLIQLILFAVIGGTAVLIPSHKSSEQWIVGGGLVLVGLLIGLYAITEHGRVNRGGPSALPTPNQQADLITSGLYKRIRHPIYTGVLMVALGITIWHGHFIILTASILLVGLLTYKSLYEEELLRAQYPQYQEYMQSTGRFLPKIF